VEIFDECLGAIQVEEKDMHQRANTLAAAYGNAGVLAIRSENTEAGIEWLEKALAVFENVKGVSNMLRQELQDQLEYAQNLKRFTGDGGAGDEENGDGMGRTASSLPSAPLDALDEASEGGEMA